jgi:hypothetical protein
VVEFSRQRLEDLDDELDTAIERLSEQQAALLQMSAEYNRKSDAHCALARAARLEAPSGAALPKRPGDDAKAPGGQFNYERYLISQVVMNPRLGREQRSECGRAAEDKAWHAINASTEEAWVQIGIETYAKWLPKSLARALKAYDKVDPAS